MSASLAGYFFKQYFDDNGNPLADGKIWAYNAGTGDLKDTFSNSTGGSGNKNTNPITLSASGRTKIYLEEGTYDFVIKNSTGTTIDTESGVAGNAGGANSMQTVASIDDLKALVAGSSSYVTVAGYYGNGTKGGGIFYWNSSSTASDNAGTIIIPNSGPGTGRWYRIFKGAVDITFFGATGNGSSDDFTAINTAAIYVQALTYGGELYFPLGLYNIESNITFGTKVRITKEKGAQLLSTDTITINGTVDLLEDVFFPIIGTVTFASSACSKYLDPRWFGAKIDGITDDIQAWTRVIASCPTGGAIKVPLGISLIKSTLNISRGYITFEGEGHKCCMLFENTSANTDGLVFNIDGGAPDAFIHQVKLNNFCLASGNPNGGNYARDLLVMELCDFSSTNNLFVLGASRYDTVLQSCILCDFDIISSINCLPYTEINAANSNQGKLRIKAIKTYTIGDVSTNSCKIHVKLAGTNTYTLGTQAAIFIEDQGEQGNNYITGSCESMTDGRAIHIIKCSTTSISDFHGEQPSSIFMDRCFSCSIGSGVRVQGSTSNPAIKLTTCSSILIDGVEVIDNPLTIDSDCRFTSLGMVTYNGTSLSDSSNSTTVISGQRYSSNVRLSQTSKNIVDAENILWNGDFKRFESGAPASFGNPSTSVAFSQTGINPNTGIALSDTFRHYGTNACKFVTSAAGSIEIQIPTAGNTLYPSTAGSGTGLGKWLTLDMWVYSLAAAGSLNITVQTVNDGDSDLSEGSSIDDVWNRVFGTYRVQKVDGTIPTTTSILISWNGAGTFYLADMSLRAGFGTPNILASAGTFNKNFLSAGNNKITFGNTIPRTGNGNVGDLHISTNTVNTGETTSIWRCVADGTPGTWITANSFFYVFDKTINNFTACATSTTTNINIASAPASGAAALDNTAVTPGVSRILVWFQTTPSENGIYIWNGSGNAMTRATDLDSISTEAIDGYKVYVTAGTAWGGRQFRLNNTYPSTDITFSPDTVPSFYPTFYNGYTSTNATLWPSSNVGAVYGMSLPFNGGTYSYQYFHDSVAQVMYIRYGAGTDTWGNWVQICDGTSVTQTFADGKIFSFGGTIGSKFGNSTAEKMGWYNKTPVIQQSATGTTAGFTANVGATVKDDSTFSGNEAGGLYTIGDIVGCLKRYGFLS